MSGNRGYTLDELKAAHSDLLTEYHNQFRHMKTEQRLGEHMQILLEELEKKDENLLAPLFEKHPLLDEIYQFTWRGPVGLGLGKIGGHAIGDED